MATINKRQQVRNERGLQELIKTVPGNDRCADCATKNPGSRAFLPWAISRVLTDALQDGQAGV
jgi:hypothetical protein